MPVNVFAVLIGTVILAAGLTIAVVAGAGLPLAWAGGIALIAALVVRLVARPRP